MRVFPRALKSWEAFPCKKNLPSGVNWMYLCCRRAFLSSTNSYRAAGAWGAILYFMFVWCDVNESNIRPIGYQPIALPLSYERSFGAYEWTRTTNTWIFNPLLYHWSYAGIKFFGVNNGLRSHTTTFTESGASTTLCSPQRILLVGLLGFEPRVLLVKSQMFLPLNYKPFKVIHFCSRRTALLDLQWAPAFRNRAAATNWLRSRGAAICFRFITFSCYWTKQKHTNDIGNWISLSYWTNFSNVLH